MPDTLSLSAGVSLGLLAGIVSGVCYVVANGLNWPKPEEERRRKRLTCSPDEGVCITCGGDKNGGLVPCICLYQKPVKFESGAWFLRQVQKAISLMPWTISSDKLEQIDEECESPGPLDSRGDLSNVREFLEALSAKLAGGPLEGTRVAPLYHHPAYLPAQNSQSSASRPGATAAHVQLKRLVARVVEEAAALPALARYAAEPTTPNDASTYEDLLATAILNKVIERYQTENGSGGRSSGIHSASASPSPSDRSSPRSVNSRHNRDITPPLREEDEDVSDWEEGETSEALELPRRVPFPEFGRDVIHHTENAERDFDEVSGSDIQAVDGSWEENWLFQKKKIKTIQSVPVPMLVPNSNADYRVLIGDRDADDTTDLSDNASDAEEESDYKSDMRRVLDSKHVIGGKTIVEDSLDESFEPDSLTIINGGEDYGKGSKRDYVANDNLIDATNNEINETTNKVKENDAIMILSIDSGPISKAEFSVKEDIHRALLNGNPQEYARSQDNSNDEVFNSTNDSNNKSSTNTLSRHEREGEYEETVTIPVQRYADSLRRKHFEDEPQQIPTRDIDYEDELLPGTVAYRERKKWLNCVEMPNNPYSPEAIQKRLSSKSTSSLFDIITKTKDLDEDITDISKSTDNVVTNCVSLGKENVSSDKENQNENKESNFSRDVTMNGSRTKSPSPKILKDALAEEIPEFKRYGRDYYIKEAKASSGGRKKSSFSDTSSLTSMSKATSLDNFDTELISPGLLIKQFNNIAVNQHYNNFSHNDGPDSITTSSNNNKTKILIEYDDVNDQSLFSAQPVYVDDTDEKFEEIFKSASEMQPLNIIVDESIEEPEQSPSNVSVDQSFMSTSSIDDSIKIYNVQTGEILKSKPVDNISPRYENAADSNDNIDMADKNIPVKSDDVISQSSDVEQDIVIIDSLEEPLENHIDNEIKEILATLPKVKELAKKFVSMDNLNEAEVKPIKYTRRRPSKDNLLSPDKPINKNAYMHSLTARSISREFREELKLSMTTPLKIPGGTKDIPEGIEEVTKESSRAGSPLPEPGTLKTKLAFFESLRSKFSNK